MFKHHIYFLITALYIWKEWYALFLIILCMKQKLVYPEPFRKHEGIAIWPSATPNWYATESGVMLALKKFRIFGLGMLTSY